MNDRDLLEFLNWRIDQLAQMVIELANAVGQHEMAYSMTKFQNDVVVPEAKKLTGDD